MGRMSRKQRTNTMSKEENTKTEPTNDITAELQFLGEIEQKALEAYANAEKHGDRTTIYKEFHNRARSARRVRELLVRRQEGGEV